MQRKVLAACLLQANQCNEHGCFAYVIVAVKTNRALNAREEPHRRKDVPIKRGGKEH